MFWYKLSLVLSFMVALMVCGTVGWVIFLELSDRYFWWSYSRRNPLPPLEDNSTYDLSNPLSSNQLITDFGRQVTYSPAVAQSAPAPISNQANSFAATSYSPGMQRGVGWCLNEDCELAFKAMFLLRNKLDSYTCSRCQSRGRSEPEQYHLRNELLMAGEIRVHFDFDCRKGDYQAVAILRDENIRDLPHNIFTFSSPLIVTKKRAMRIAEACFANLQQNPRLFQKGVRPILKTEHHLLNFDLSLEDFQKECQNLENKITGSFVNQAYLVRNAGLTQDDLEDI